jgi:hypothetical protein
VLVVTLAIARPRGGLSHEALRLLPDVLRLVRRRAGLAAVGRHWPGTPTASPWLPPHRAARVELDAVTRETPGATQGLGLDLAADGVPSTSATTTCSAKPGGPDPGA